LEFINTVLGIPLGYIIFYAYRLTDSYGLAVLIFAVVVRVFLFPVNVLTHRNSIRLLQLQPYLIRLKQRYANDKERLNEERYNLFKKEKYSPLLGVVPLVIQLILIVGVMQVMYNLFQHMLRLDQSIIDTIVLSGRELFGVPDGSGEQLRIIEILQVPENILIFQSANADLANYGGILQAIAATDLSFLGLNLGAIPSFANPTPVLLIPLISGLTSLALCLSQTAISPGALSQGKKTNWGLTIFTVVFTIYFTIVTPAGVGVYWSAKNILGIAVLLILNLLYNPKKLAGEALEFIRSDRKTSAQIHEERRRIKALRLREKQDASRFMAAKKHLVFYALTGGQYKYYKNIIEYLIDNSDIVIHYLTNDPKDSLFKTENERLIPYYASEKRTITLLLRLDTDILVTTVPGLQNYHMKRSIAREDIEYIYVRHALGSVHMLLRENALDHYDTVFCTGPHQVAELRRREELAGLPRRTLVKAGYGLYDQLVEFYNAISQRNEDKPRVLIAPSWQVDNIIEICIEDMLDTLIGKGYIVIVRPHPQELRMFPNRFESLRTRYSPQIAEGEVILDLDFSSNESIFVSDILITDWSSIAFEFSFCTLKPSIFINTPMKVMNPNYERYGMEVTNITLRDVVGVSVDVDDVSNVDDVVAKLLREKDAFKNQIEETLQNYIYHHGRSGEAGGKYIVSRIAEKNVTM
jgi:YidC/Oxa1 family membrane protein insertase